MTKLSCQKPWTTHKLIRITNTNSLCLTIKVTKTDSINISTSQISQIATAKSSTRQGLVPGSNQSKPTPTFTKAKTATL